MINMKEAEEDRQKSSKEILLELFDTFNATPPRSPSLEDCKDKKKDSKERRNSKHKKKRKKEKKSRRDDKQKNRDSKQDKRIKKKKKYKHKSSSHCDSSDSSSKESCKDSSSYSEKQKNHVGVFKTVSNTTECTTNKAEAKAATTKNVISETRGEANSSNSELTTEKSNPLNSTLPDLIPTGENPQSVTDDCQVKGSTPIKLEEKPVQKVADVFVEDLLASGDKTTKVLSSNQDKQKSIKISNLKTSSILETAEEMAKLKAEKFEEGELTNDTSSEGSAGERKKKVEENEKKKRHKSKKHKRHSRSPPPSSSKRVVHVIKKSRSRSRSPIKKTSGSKKRSHSRSRSASKTVKKVTHSKEKTSSHRSDSKEKSSRRKKERSRERRKHSDRKERSRERSKERKSGKDSDKKSDRRRGRSREKRKGRSKSPLELPSLTISRKRKSRSRSRSRVLEIDKKKLLEIARKNALSMMKQGTVGTDQGKVATITAGGKTVNELTDFCKQLSQKEGGEESLSSLTNSSDSESEKPFHHPFLIKDRPSNIVMNIRNCASIPVKTHQEKTAENAQQLRLQFPVSSGQQHRKTESEWIPVSPKKEELPNKVTANEVKKVTEEQPTEESPPVPLTIEPPPLPPPELTSVFPVQEEKYDIGEMVSQRLNAMKQLQENPNDYHAQMMLYSAEQKMSKWTESHTQPGLFTGTTGARMLTPAELSSGAQAWAKKDQLICAQPVTGGMGMSLLQKMGWKPGEGLGKNQKGSLEPLSIPLKMDKKGLSAAEELKRQHRSPFLKYFKKGPSKNKTAVSKAQEGKHPVSLLIEYCTRMHYNPPCFSVYYESGPSHKRSFIFKVEVNGIQYNPSVASPNKKQAKSEAAILCLKKLGIMQGTNTSD